MKSVVLVVAPLLLMGGMMHVGNHRVVEDCPRVVEERNYQEYDTFVESVHIHRADCDGTCIKNPGYECWRNIENDETVNEHHSQKSKHHGQGKHHQNRHH